MLRSLVCVEVDPHTHWKGGGEMAGEIDAGCLLITQETDARK